MNSAKMIHTLWVDNEPDDRLIESCLKEGIQIVKAENSDKGLTYLEQNWRKIDFIIIDALDTRVGDVTNGRTCGAYDMLAGIQRYSRDKQIPYCMYTAYVGKPQVKNLEKQFPGLTIFKKTDPKERKPIFNPAYRRLIDFIKAEALLTEERQIKDMYADVFDAAGTLELEEKYRETLMRFMKALSFVSHREDCPEPDDMRYIIEYICKRYYEAGLVPRECFKLKKGRIAEINITDALKFLSGKKPDNVLGKPSPMGVFDSKGPVLPELMAELMDSALNYSHKYSHDNHIVDDPDAADANPKMSEYERSIKTPLYKFSAFLNLCDFIQFSAEYLTNHSDVKENKKRCIRLAKVCEKSPDGKSYIVRRNADGTCHVGDYIKLAPKGTKGKDKDSKKVSVNDGDLIEFTWLSENTKPNDPYRFYASEYTIL